MPTPNSIQPSPPIDVYIKEPGGSFNINDPNGTPWANHLDYSSDDNQLQIIQTWGRQGATAQVPLTDEYQYEMTAAAGQPNFIIQAMSEIRIVNHLIHEQYESNNPNNFDYSCLFAGFVQDPQMYRYSPNLIQWYLQCLDYSLSINCAIVNQAYSGLTMDLIVVDVVNSVSAVTGVTAATVANGGHVAPGVYVPFISFQWQTLANAIQQATLYGSQNAQYGWYIDWDKKFHFFNQFQAPSPIVLLTDTPAVQTLTYTTTGNNGQHGSPPSIPYAEVTLTGSSNTSNLIPGMLFKDGAHNWTGQIISITDNTHFLVDPGAPGTTSISSSMIAYIGQQETYYWGGSGWTPTPLPTPFIGHIETDIEFFYEWDGTQLYNEIYVLGTMVTQPLNILLAPTDVFTCDGTQRSFSLTWPVLQEDTSAIYIGVEAFLTLDGVPYIVGLQAAEAGGNPLAGTTPSTDGAPTIQPSELPPAAIPLPQTAWYINQSSTGQWLLSAAPSTPTPRKGQKLWIWYSYQIPNVAVASDAGSVAKYGQRFQELVNDGTLLTATAAFARAARELTEYSRVEERLNAYTNEGMVGHFNAGDVIACNLTMVPDSLNNFQIGTGSFTSANNQFIVTNNTITFLDTGYLQYQFEALRIATSG